MLNILRKIVYEVNTAPDINSGLKLAVARIKEALNTDVASVYLLNKEDSRYYLMASEGLNETAVGNVSLGLMEGLVGQVGLREEPINLENAALHPKFHYIKATGEERYHSFLGVPIIHYRQLLGVLVVQQQAERRFEQNEEAFLVTLSAQLGSVIALVTALDLFAKDSDHKRSSTYSGIAVASGVGIGEAVVYYPKAVLEAVPQRQCQVVEDELVRLRRALEAVRADIRSLSLRIETSLGPEESALFNVYLRMLDDAALGGEIAARIEEDKLWAESALAQVIGQHVRNFELMDDAYLRERASDVKDLGLRVLEKLEAERVTAKRKYPESCVLVGEEITASMLAEIPREHLVAVVSVQGAINSHMSIVARSMGIPTVVGLLGLPISQLESKSVIVDGYRGDVITHPTDDMLTEYRGIVLEEQRLLANLDQLVDKKCKTPDSVEVALWVNTGLLSDVPLQIRRCVAGVGLYRSEVPFMMRERFPSEEEQQSIYRKQLAGFAPKPVTMRTLDIGGDKRLPYFPIYEENPALGWRGIRVTLDHPEIFLVQVRAMMKASEGFDNLRILLPMVSTVFEVEQAMHLLHRAYFEVIEEGASIVMPKIGVMIEVPAAAYQVRALASRVDFLAVGSNDMAQYLLAVDRNNPRVASLYSTFHPALLQALKNIVEGAKIENKPISICGEMAGDPGAALLLMAMGYRHLSMSSANLLKVKSAICKVTMVSACNLLDDVLAMDNAEVIHSYLDLALEQLGLSGFLRPLYRR